MQAPGPLLKQRDSADNPNVLLKRSTPTPTTAASPPLLSDGFLANDLVVHHNPKINQAEVKGT